MASITKRTNKDGSASYLIRAYIEEGSGGKQVTKAMTWKPPAGMSPAKAEKQAEKEAVLFEERARIGILPVDGKTKFEDYAARWMETAELAPTTRSRYYDLLRRINPAIGHIRLEKLQSHHLEAFYQNLKEDGIKEKGRYATSDKLASIMKERGLSLGKLAKQANVAPATVATARDGKRISISKGEQIAAALQIKTTDLFVLCESTTGLADKTIRHHHQLISTILAKAKRTRIIPYNVASEHVTAPKLQRKEAAYLDSEQARHVVELLLAEEDIRKTAAILLLLYSGVRRGELCGLEWSDIDFKQQMIYINRASQYQRGNGIAEVPTKNESSERSIKLPALVFSVLAQYREWWMAERDKLGDAWVGNKERLFIQFDGKPINPDTINYWLERFREKHSLPHFTPHSCRHTFCSLQLAAGVDIRTLQARSGHAQASTLVNTYSHVIKTAAEAASDVLDDVLTPRKEKRGSA